MECVEGTAQLLGVNGEPAKPLPAESEAPWARPSMYRLRASSVQRLAPSSSAFLTASALDSESVFSCSSRLFTCFLSALTSSVVAAWADFAAAAAVRAIDAAAEPDFAELYRLLLAHTADLFSG